MKQDPKDIQSAEVVLDFKLLKQAYKKFGICGFEAIRLEAMMAKCRMRTEAAQAIIGGDWDEMTRQLLKKDLIRLPETGPAEVTEKAARFLTIHFTPIIKN